MVKLRAGEDLLHCEPFAVHLRFGRLLQLLCGAAGEFARVQEKQTIRVLFARMLHADRKNAAYCSQECCVRDCNNIRAYECKALHRVHLPNGIDWSEEARSEATFLSTTT